MSYIVHKENLTPDELTEMALAKAQEATFPLATVPGMFGYIPTIRLAFTSDTCIPQTVVYRTLQKHYDMVTVADVTIGEYRAVSMMHRENYDHIVEQDAV